MASTRGIKGYFDFSKGVVTEGSKLTHEENSLLDSLNMSFSPGKPLAKRLGMLVNQSFDSLTTSEVSGDYTGSWYWEAPSGFADRAVLVVGMGNHVVGISVDGPLEQAFNLDLSDVLQEAFGAPSGSVYFTTSETSFTAISNKLYVVCYGEDRGNTASRVVSIEFENITNDGFSSPVIQVLDIQYRDFGDASTYDLNDQMNPARDSLSQYGAIIYDMFNRGFPHVTGPYKQSSFLVGDSLDGGRYPVSGRDPIDFYNSRLGRYPTKSTVFALGLANYPGLSFESPRTNKYWDVDPYRAQNINFGSAATGHVILSAYSPQRWKSAMELMNRGDDTNGVDTTPNPEPEVFTSAATWYGRACWGTSSGKVFMSKLYKDSRNNIAGKCYQEQDPTDPEFNELLATDGTVIDIGGAGSIIGMAPLGNSLVLITNQGVWELQGSSESYSIQAVSVSKLLSDACTEKNSIISFPGGIAFFADAAIYVVQRDATLGTLSPTAVTDSTIKSLYSDSYAEGVSSVSFDYKNQRIEWLYSDGRILQFDTRTGAFFPQKVEGAEDALRIAHRTPRLYQVPQTEDVVSYDPVTGETDNVLSDGEQVTTESTTVADTPDTGLVYYKVAVEDVGGLRGFLTRGSFLDETMMDYGDNVYRAYAEAGYDTFSDPTANKEIDTLFAWFEITEDGITELPGGGYELENQSACDLSVKWEWSSSGVSNRWYDAGNIYRLPVEYIVDENDLTLDLGYSVAPSTRGIPGSGKSVVFRFDDQEGKHMRLLGWAVAAANEVNP